MTHLILIVSFFVGYRLSIHVLLLSNSMYCGSSWEIEAGRGLDGCTTIWVRVRDVRGVGIDTTGALRNFHETSVVR
jgi:hypothetical protein